MKNLYFILLLTALCSCSSEPDTEIRNAQDLALSLKSYQEKLPKANKGEWRYTRKEESQSIEEYITNTPVQADSLRTRLYLQLLDFPISQQGQLIYQLEIYLSEFFQVELVVVNDTSTLNQISSIAKRVYFDKHQLHSKHIIYHHLEPNLPGDAIGVMGLTIEDLFPDPEWDFVFGQTSLHHRAGITSTNRLQSNSDSTFLRISRTLTHEMVHLFGIQHCSTHKCLMNGSAILKEADRKPHHLCHECYAKLSWNRAWDHKKRCNDLSQFWNSQNQETQSNYYQGLDSTIRNRAH